MIQAFLELLVEFGLIREDIKHQKRVSEKEKEDGKKRTFQKYVLQPSAKIFIAIIVIGGITAFFYFRYERQSIYPQKTHEEITAMSKRLKKWKDKFGEYPKDLETLIGNSPIQQDWKTDAWDRPYQYSLIDNDENFIIVSAGSDGKFDTKDDIKSN